MTSEVEELTGELSELKKSMELNPEACTSKADVLLTNSALLELQREDSKDEKLYLDSVSADVKMKQEKLRKIQSEASQPKELNACLRELEEKKKWLDTAKKLLKSEISNEKNDEMQIKIVGEMLKMVECLGINWEDASKRSEMVDRLHYLSSKLGYVSFAEYLFVLDPELKERTVPSHDENKIRAKTSSSENIEKNKNELGIEERKETSGNTPSFSHQSAYKSLSHVNEKIPENAASSKEEILVVTVSAFNVKTKAPEEEKSRTEHSVCAEHTYSAQEELLETKESELKNVAEKVEKKKLPEESKEKKSKKEHGTEAQRHVELENMLKFRKNTTTDKCSEFRAYRFFKKVFQEPWEEATLDLVKALKLEEECITLRGNVAERVMFMEAYEGNSKLVNFLLKKLPELRDKSFFSGLYPLHIAVLKNHVETVEVLLKGGVNVNVKNSAGADALGAAVHEGNISIVEMLLKFGAVINAQDMNLTSPLHIAATKDDGHQGRLKCLQLLLDSQANKEIRDERGATPLIEAVLTDNMEAVDILLQAGADVNAQDKFGYSPLHLAIRDGHIQVFKRLLQSTVNLELGDGLRRTALHSAVSLERADFITELLKAGANRLARDRGGMIPAQLTKNSHIKALLYTNL